MSAFLEEKNTMLLLTGKKQHTFDVVTIHDKRFKKIIIIWENRHTSFADTGIIYSLTDAAYCATGIAANVDFVKHSNGGISMGRWSDHHLVVQRLVNVAVIVHVDAGSEMVKSFINNDDSQLSLPWKDSHMPKYRLNKID